MSFASDLARFGDKTQFKADQALRKVSLEMFGRVIMRTPVDTGRLRGNWQATIGKPAEGETSLNDAGAPANASGSGSGPAKAAMQEVVLGANKPTVFYLTNTLPYASVVEYGSSDQAPKGMVRITAAEFEGIVDQVVNAL